MNREQKRKYIRQLKSKGYSKKDIDLFIYYKELDETKNELPEGTKVKLDVEKIKSHPDYSGLTKKYRNWVDAHKDDIFSVEYDKDYPVIHNATVYLKNNGKKSLFKFWVGNLKVVE